MGVVQSQIVLAAATQTGNGAYRVSDEVIVVRVLLAVVCPGCPGEGSAARHKIDQLTGLSEAFTPGKYWKQ
jgi:DnaJ-class molecular chaperone